MARFVYWQKDESSDFEHIGNVTTAKKLMKQYPSSTAHIEHCERDGCCFEVTPIELKRGNSGFKYNHHL